MDERYPIVEAAPKHLAAIPRIELAAATLFSTADLPLGIRHRVTDHGELASAQQDGRLWTALGPGRLPVGFALATLLDGQAHLDEMDVDPAHGRQGIGTRLVHTVIDWARSRRFENLTLMTFRHLPWNAPFYAKLGFVPLSTREMAEAGIDTAKRVGMRLELG